MSENEEQFLFRSERLARHFWADNEVYDLFAPQLGCDGFAVYMGLCRVAINGTGECSISLSKMAAQLGMSKGAVFNALKTIIATGLIRLIKPGDPRHASVYQLADVKSLVDSEHKQMKLSGHMVTADSITSGHTMTANGHTVTAAVTTRPPNKEDKTSSRLKTKSKSPQPPFLQNGGNQQIRISARTLLKVSKEMDRLAEASVGTGVTDDQIFEAACARLCLPWQAVKAAMTESPAQVSA